MLTWSTAIQSVDDIPAIYQSAYQKLISAQEKIPYTVLTPPITGTRYKPSEKLIFEMDNVFYILERLKKGVVKTEYSLSEISYFETGSILLYSWLSVSGLTKNREYSTSTIPYNTATHRHIEPFLTKIRTITNIDNTASLESELAKFDYLAPLNFKFMNYARKSLRGDERVIYSIWQPEIKRSIFSFSKWTIERTLDLPHIAILTDKEVILIAEDKRSPAKKGKRYGGVWQYIPLQKIDSVSIKQHSEGMSLLSLKIIPEAYSNLLFEDTNRSGIIHFKDELEKRLVIIHSPK